jgi:hypothetical protein
MAEVPYWLVPRKTREQESTLRGTDIAILRNWNEGCRSVAGTMGNGDAVAGRA